jgi:hypothetical protein
MEVIVFLVLVAILAAIARPLPAVRRHGRDYQRASITAAASSSGLSSTGTHYAIADERDPGARRPAGPAHRSGPGDPHARRRRPEDQPDGAVVSDPVAAITNDQSFTALYAALHAGCATRRGRPRTTCSRSGARSGRGRRGRERHRPIGVELLNVDVRDVMVPSESKRAYAGIGARREGEAALERARGEQAALRALANAGRLLEESPGLLQLRVIQQLGASSGNTIAPGSGTGRRPPMPPPHGRRRIAMAPLSRRAARRGRTTGDCRPGAMSGSV